MFLLRILMKFKNILQRLLLSHYVFCVRKGPLNLSDKFDSEGRLVNIMNQISEGIQYPGYPHPKDTTDLFTPIAKVLRMRSYERLSREFFLRDNFLALHLLADTKDRCSDCERLRKEEDQIQVRMDKFK